MEKQPSNNSTPTPEVTDGVDHSLDELFESTSSSRQPDIDTTDLWDEPSTPSRPAETIDTESIWGDSFTSTPSPSQELEPADPFNSEQFVSPNQAQEAGGGLFQRIRDAASREKLDSALEIVTEVASSLGGMAVEATVSAAGVVKGKAGEVVDVTREFIADEEHQEAAKRFAIAGVKIAKDGALGKTGLDILNDEGGLKKVKAAREALRAIRNPARAVAKVGKGIVEQGRQQLQP